MSKKTIRKTILGDKTILDKYCKNIPSSVNPVNIVPSSIKPSSTLQAQKILTKAKTINKKGFRDILEELKEKTNNAPQKQSKFATEKKLPPKLARIKSIGNMMIFNSKGLGSKLKNKREDTKKSNLDNSDSSNTERIRVFPLANLHLGFEKKQAKAPDRKSVV